MAEITEARLVGDWRRIVGDHVVSYENGGGLDDVGVTGTVTLTPNFGKGPQGVLADDASLYTAHEIKCRVMWGRLHDNDLNNPWQDLIVAVDGKPIVWTAAFSLTYKWRSDVQAQKINLPQVTFDSSAILAGEISLTSLIPSAQIPSNYQPYLVSAQASAQVASDAKTVAELSALAADQAKVGATLAKTAAETAKTAAETAAALATTEADRAVGLATAQDQAVADTVTAGGPTTTALNATYGRRGESEVSVLDYGAVATGTEADAPSVTAAIQSAITDNPGRRIRIPQTSPLGQCVYRVDTAHQMGTDGQTALVIDNGATLVLDRGVQLAMVPTAASHYTIVELDGAGPGIDGLGSVVGDVGWHLGSDGQQGYCVLVAGASDAYVGPITTTLAWGDGVMILGDATDTVIDHTIADNNRRNGFSDIHSTRTKWFSPTGRRTGVAQFTDPGAGICIEPDPESGNNVVDFILYSPTCHDNLGDGINISCGAGQSITGRIIGGASFDNTGSGFVTLTVALESPTVVDPAGFDVTVSTLDAVRNGVNGMTIGAKTAVRASGVTVTDNSNWGIATYGTLTLSVPNITDNETGSLFVDVGAGVTTIAGGIAGTTRARTAMSAAEVLVQAKAAISGLAMVNRAAVYQANWGIQVSASAGPETTVLNVTGAGPVGSGWLNNEAGATVLPTPGASRYTLTYSRSEETNLTAQMRLALNALGLVTDATVA